MRQSVWQGDIGDRTFRVVKVSGDDCLVEELVVAADDSRFLSAKESPSLTVDGQGAWSAPDDETSSRVYVSALIEVKRQLDLAVSMMGTREAADFLAALEKEKT